MKGKISKPVLVLKFLLALPVMMIVLFWPAGTLHWVEGWVYLILQLSYSGLLAIYFLKRNPDMIRKRMELKLPSRLWDRVVMIPFILSMVSLLIVPGFDVIRYGWSEIPVWLEIIGFIGFMASSYIIFLVMKENSFLLKTVEIQEGHKVVSTGPYHYVRHPMYSGTILMRTLKN